MAQTDRNVSEMSHRELTREWDDVVEAQRLTADADAEQELYDRRQELWNEMQSRVDAEPPTCPECGAQSWSQAMGEPKVCTECDLHLGFDHEDLAEQINDYWNTVQSPGVASDA